jgi:hypothetical protein
VQIEKIVTGRSRKARNIHRRMLENHQLTIIERKSEKVIASN